MRCLNQHLHTEEKTCTEDLASPQVVPPVSPRFVVSWEALFSRMSFSFTITLSIALVSIMSCGPNNEKKINEINSFDTRVSNIKFSI